MGFNMQHKVLLTLAYIFTTLNCAHASDPAIRAVYGDGVHSFYSGDFQQSHDYLSQVIDLGTDDPRVYYFRGLSALQLGKRKAADADFKKGAGFEAERGNMRTVSRAIERIQGPDRLLLEQCRATARLALAERQEPRPSGTRQSFLSSGQRYSGIGGVENKEKSTQQIGETGAPTPEPEVPAIAADRTDEPQPMQTLGAEKAQRDSDAFFGKKDKEGAEMPDAAQPVASDADTKKRKTLFDDPFGDDPFADAPRRTDPMPDQPSPDPDSETMTVGDSDDPFNFAPRKPAGSTMQRDQIEKQNEMLDAEAADSRDQREAMNERDAAAGD